MYVLHSKSFMEGNEDEVNEKRSIRHVEMWIDVWRINQVNEKFHELGTGCLRKFYGPGMVNDPHILKIGIRIDSVHCISI